MAIKPVLNELIEKQPIYPSLLNENYDMLLNYLDNSIKEHLSYLTNSITQLQDQFTPVGIVIGYPANNIPKGYLICDGTQYNKTDYAELYAVIGNIYNKENDGDPAKFRVPDFRDVFLRGAGGEHSASLGITQSSAIPNITGRFETPSFDGHNTVFGTSGAFNPSQSGAKYGNYRGDGTQVKRGGADFDASLVSDVYKNDIDEVRPTNQSIIWVIKASNTIGKVA